MLTLNLKGGLGNILFEIAAGEKISEQTGIEVYWPECTPATHHSSVNYFDSILANFKGKNSEKYNKSDKLITMGEKPFMDWSTVLEKDKHYYLDGYFQDYRYIPDNFHERLILPNITMNYNSAFIHIRGGDYVNHWLHDVGLNRGMYYQIAMAFFPPDTVFYLLSNDMEFVNSLPWLKQYKNIVYRYSSSTEMDLSMMASCPYGGICANSTFSWWSAWIGSKKYSNAKYVMPKRWFNDGTQCEKYHFPNSIVI